MSNQLCIPNGETCVDCSEYAAAFSCLPKIKISGMPELSQLDTIAILDSKCEDILFPISTISCEKDPESFSLSLKELLDIIGHTSIGERQAFPDKEFTAEGQVEEYELTVFNPHKTRNMQISYFAQWSVHSLALDNTASINHLISNTYIDGEQVDQGGGYDAFVEYDQDAGSMPFIYTKVIGPKEYTTIKMELICARFEGTLMRAETIQLMITGTTR